MAQNKKWLEKIFVQPMSRFANFRITKSISAGFQSGVNVLMVGAMLSVLSIIFSLIPGINTSVFLTKFNLLKDLIFGITGLIFTYGIAAANAKLNKIDQQSAGFLAIGVFFIFMKPSIMVDENYTSIFTAPFARFGMQAVFVSIVAGIWAGEICALFKRHGWIMNSEGLPDIAKVWFENLIAGTFIVLSAWVFTDIVNINLHTIFDTLLIPVMGIMGSFWGWILLVTIPPLLFYFGIHPASIMSLLGPVYWAALAKNVQLLAAGLVPTVANGFFIVNMGTLFMMNLGGTGATLGLNILMLLSKNKATKKLGQLAILPSILNINEPIIFGLPILYNPVLFIPFILGNFINAVIAYVVLDLGWVAIPSTYSLLTYVPAPLNAYLLTQDFKAVVLILLLIGIDMTIWAPFLKMHERNLLSKDSS
ncbi:MAG: PTS sugar transporter subunit IIC [Chloroflexi bacterium]|nr:PTS sugar transporter subunit IIC [Chloroflexota bacterium]